MSAFPTSSAVMAAWHVEYAAVYSGGVAMLPPPTGATLRTAIDNAKNRNETESRCAAVVGSR